MNRCATLVVETLAYRGCPPHRVLYALPGEVVDFEPSPTVADFEPTPMGEPGPSSVIHGAVRFLPVRHFPLAALVSNGACRGLACKSDRGGLGVRAALGSR